MPKYVTQLAQGNTFGVSSDSGAGAYQATRSWKVILNTPDEPIDINAVTGVDIGTIYSAANPIPCVSIEGRADGESRLIRIITATYRATPSAAPGVEDPKTQEPTVRPAMYSMSTSLTEIAAWGGRLVTNGVSGSWLPATNPAGDLVDGISRLEPVVNINIEQYSSTDMSNLLGYSGYVNSDQINFSSLAIGVHCCMLQGITSNPIVERFGESTFRGFKVAFTFAVRAHYTITRYGATAVGWDLAVPQTGFNIINSGLFNTPLYSGNGGDGSRPDIDPQALVLSHEDGKVKLTAYGAPVGLATPSGTKVRAMVTIPASESGGYAQRPASQPVALNDDGTPRARTATPPVLINRICLQPEMAFGNNFSNFGIRWIS